MFVVFENVGYLPNINRVLHYPHDDRMDAVTVFTIMINGIWLFLPAMVPNSGAALVGGGPTIDCGMKWRGKRIFGDGKTWRGFFGGALIGIIFGAILIDIAYFFDPKDFWGYGLLWNNIGIVICLSFGAVLGDLMGAFIKRRFGLKRGEKAPILDQYDFVFGAFVVTAIFYSDWIYTTYFEGWHIVALLLLLLVMFAVHRGVNIIGYKLGVKKEPW